jgi:hypothetical protein
MPRERNSLDDIVSVVLTYEWRIVGEGEISRMGDETITVNDDSWKKEQSNSLKRIYTQGCEDQLLEETVFARCARMEITGSPTNRAGHDWNMKTVLQKGKDSSNDMTCIWRGNWRRCMDLVNGLKKR